MIESLESTTKKILQPKLLIGEGVEEVRFFEALLKHMRIEDVQVEEYGGKKKLHSYLRTLKVRTGFNNLTSLGITRDADESATSAFESVCSGLTNSELPVPETTRIVAIGAPSVSVFVLPDCRNNGMLEDLCLSFINHTDTSVQCIEQYLACVHQQTTRQPLNVSKAKVYIWLASQVKTGRKLAEAAEANYWNWDCPVFDDLKQFLGQL